MTSNPYHSPSELGIQEKTPDLCAFWIHAIAYFAPLRVVLALVLLVALALVEMTTFDSVRSYLSIVVFALGNLAHVIWIAIEFLALGASSRYTNGFSRSKYLWSLSLMASILVVFVEIVVLSFLHHDDFN